MMKLIKKPVRELGRQLLTVNDRIEYIRCVLGYDVTGFSRKIGSSPAALTNVLSKRGDDPSIKMINSILTLFPVNKEWIFMGTGEPFSVRTLTAFMSTDRTGGADLDETITGRLKEIRTEKGMSQAIFASKIGMSRDSYAFLETNKSTLQLSALKKLLLEFNLNCRWILFGAGERYIKK